ncbi:MAG: ABC transporter ATP-binding protein, partial [Actinomycetota bacterium]|nr:ABC transporter ATP-binding protein [Actinomycetota bacterium]
MQSPGKVGKTPDRGAADARGASPAPPVISTRGLSKSYKRVQALKPLDLAVPKNSIFGFLGPNGAGK